MAVSRRRIYHKRERLKQLRAFHHSANLNSMTQAAERLGLSQPAVSLHVRELEHELETALFDRSGPHIALTEAGEILYELVSPLVEGVDDLFINFAEELRDNPSGDIALGASHGAAAYVLPPLLKSFRDLYPGIRLHVRRCAVRDGFRLLLAGDIEFLTGPRESFPGKSVEDKIAYHPMFHYDLVLITSPDHSLAGRESPTREEIADSPMIVPSAGTYSTRSGESAIREFNLEPNVAIEAGGWSTVKRYVEAGLGIAMIPSICVTAKDSLSVNFLRQHFKRASYGMYLRTDKSLSPIAERFVEFMKRYHSGPAPVPRTLQSRGE